MIWSSSLDLWALGFKGKNLTEKGKYSLLKKANQAYIQISFCIINQKITETHHLMGCCASQHQEIKKSRHSLPKQRIQKKATLETYESDHH